MMAVMGPTLSAWQAGSMVKGPPRWTFALRGSRLRVSAGLLAWLVLAVVTLVFGVGRMPFAETPAMLLGCLVVSMLVHEGAHAMGAHRLGYRVEWVVLGGLGGLTAYFGRDDRPLDRAAVAMAGPAASAAVALVLAAVRSSLTPGSEILGLVDLAIVVNALGLIANLVPVGSSDGAMVLRGLRQHRRDRQRSRVSSRS
jgi:Zn-dependent protease